MEAKQFLVEFVQVCVYYCRTYDKAVCVFYYRSGPITKMFACVPVPVCVFITAGPITKLFAGGGGGEWTTCAMIDDEPMGPVRNPVLGHRVRLFSLVPLVWESNPKLQGGWCKTQPPD